MSRATVRDTWELSELDPCGLSVYRISRVGVQIPASVEVVWQIVGPATDRLRLDVVAIDTGSVFPVSIEFQIRASFCDVVGPVVLAPFVVSASAAGQSGFVCEVRGRLTTSWDVIARRTAGGATRVGLVAHVDRIGGPFETTTANNFQASG